MVGSCPIRSSQSLFSNRLYASLLSRPALGVTSLWGRRLSVPLVDVVSALLNRSSEERGFRHAAARDFDPALPPSLSARLIYSPEGKLAEDARMRGTMNRGDQSIPLQTGRMRPMQGGICNLIQSSAKRRAPGCVNAVGKARQGKGRKKTHQS